MRKIDRNTKSRGTASRGHVGAARILRPRSPAPSVGPQRLAQRLLEDIGLGGAAHPLRRAQGIIHGQGGPMAFPLGGPKFPSWMGPRIGPGVSRGETLRGLDDGSIRAFINELDKQGGQTFFDRSNPLVSHKYPVASERRFAPEPQNLLPRKQLIEALGQMNENTPTNRGFLLWMMRHHFGNRN